MDVRSWHPFEAVRRDLRDAGRALRRQPGMAVTAVLMLGLGIGATTAIFSVVKGVLLDPLPYPDSGALVRIAHRIGGVEQPYFNDAIYTTYADHAQALLDLGVWSPGETATVTGRGNPEEVRVLRASAGVLTTLGVPPALGRWISTADDRPGAPDTVLLGYAYWQRAFGGDRAVLDRALTVNGRSHQIVGVMPAGFRFDGDLDLVLPLQLDRGALIPAFRLLGVARLRPGVTLAQADADVARVLDVWAQDFNVRPDVRARWVPALRPLKQDVVGDVGSTLWVLLGTIALLLLMACANVASLLLVRGSARHHECAVRAALGAGWRRIARQLLAESLALAALGGVLGVAVAYAGVRLLIACGPTNLPRLPEVAIDGGVLAFALAVSIVSGVVFGLVPILRFARPRLADAFAGRGGTLTRDRQRSQQALVTLQVALALVLLVGAGLMVRSFQALRGVQPGFGAPEQVQSFSISIPESLVPDGAVVARMQHDVLDRLAAIPGVTAAAFTTRVPMGSDRASAALTVEGVADDGRTPPNRQVKIVSPGYFQTLQTPLVAGRDFTWSDLEGQRPLAIVSDNLAREVWGSAEAALGKRVREYYDPSSPWREIVGVAGDVRDDGADQPPPATIYWPAAALDALQSMSGYQSRRVTMAIRSDRAGSEGFIGQVQQAVWSVSATLPLAQIRTLDAVYGQSVARTSFTSVLLTVAGAIALLLGVAGLYGVIACAVSQRQREIGVRLALGAQPQEIRALFVRRGLVPVLAGLVCGLGAAAIVTRAMRSLLFGVGPLDPIAFTAMPLALAAAAAIAGYLATQHAVAVDPVETLRAE
jgi:predicted permease